MKDVFTAKSTILLKLYFFRMFFLILRSTVVDTFTLGGSLPNHVLLDSSVDANDWDVTITTGSTVSNVSVKDSNLVGDTVNAISNNNNIDRGNNSVNWEFNGDNILDKRRITALMTLTAMGKRNKHKRLDLIF